MSSKYYKNNKLSHPKWRDEHIDFIIDKITTMTDYEIAEAFVDRFGIDITPKIVKHLINRFELEQYCEPPKTDRVWELIKYNKVQCAICGRWMQTINGAHLKKHKVTVEEYKEMFGLNATQPLCSKQLSEVWREKLPDSFMHDKEELKIRMRQIRPKSYKKRKQAIVDRIEKGIQSKAAKSLRKPREFRKVITQEMVSGLRGKGLSFLAIKKEIARLTGYHISETSIKRIHYGKRTKFKEVER